MPTLNLLVLKFFNDISCLFPYMLINAEDSFEFTIDGQIYNRITAALLAILFSGDPCNINISIIKNYSQILKYSDINNNDMQKRW